MVSKYHAFCYSVMYFHMLKQTKKQIKGYQESASLNGFIYKTKKIIWNSLIRSVLAQWFIYSISSQAIWLRGSSDIYSDDDSDQVLFKLAKCFQGRRTSNQFLLKICLICIGYSEKNIFIKNRQNAKPATYVIFFIKLELLFKFQHIL
jgi:hypothetical protein